MAKGCSWVMVALIGLGACGGDDDDSSVSRTPAAGAGAAGGMAGAGMAGMAGAAGAAGMAGSSMAGSGGMELGGCASADMTTDGAALHAAALTAMAAADSGCAKSPSCHQGSGKAKLSLLGQTDLRTLMVGKPSCEVPAIPLVADGGGDAALNNSWLWIKLTHPLEPDTNLMADPAWGTPGASCNQSTPGTFGFRMPWGLSGMTWSEAPKVRDWICKGAPGP